jgi:hypothetical protein
MGTKGHMKDKPYRNVRVGQIFSRPYHTGTYLCVRLENPKRKSAVTLQGVETKFDNDTIVTVWDCLCIALVPSGSL